MIYGSICSGIEAATVAWHPLGWKPAFFSEIADEPRAVLQHHYPDTPLHGDFTTIGADEYGAINLLIGGTPCQSFSVAGLRKGLADDRGNLTLEYVKLVKRTRPTWLVWENVQGVLSIDRGRTFATFLAGLAECGYGFAYRVLDAQYFGVPQRRRRVFVVGYFGDWRPAAAVLFERESLQGDITPRRAKGKNIAVANPLGSHGGSGYRQDLDNETYVPEIAWALQERDAKGSDSNTKEGHLIPVPINTQVATRHLALGERTGLGVGKAGDPMFTLQEHHSHAVAIPIHDKATRYKGGGDTRQDDGSSNGLGIGREGDPSPTLDTASRHGVAQGMRIRRLTPRECERLQGFADDYTLTPYGKKLMPDSARYRMLGNSMAVPVIHWIGQRIEKVESLL